MQLSERIYEDIAAQLPAIKEALAQGISYGGELFGRIIMMDMVWFSIIGSLSLIISIYLILQLKKLKKWILDGEGKINGEGRWIGTIVVVIAILIFIGVFFHSMRIILMDVFVPELRAIELISDGVTSHNNEK